LDLIKIINGFLVLLILTSLSLTLVSFSMAYEGPVTSYSSDLPSKIVRIDDEANYYRKSKTQDAKTYDKVVSCPTGTKLIDHGLTVTGSHNFEISSKYVHDDRVHWIFKAKPRRSENIFTSNLFIECRDPKFISLSESQDFVAAFSLMAGDKFESVTDDFKNNIIDSAFKLGMFGEEILDARDLSDLLIEVYEKEKERVFEDPDTVPSEEDFNKLFSLIAAMGNVRDDEMFIFLGRGIRDKENHAELRGVMRMAIAKHGAISENILKTANLDQICLNSDDTRVVYEHSSPVIDMEEDMINFEFKTKSDIVTPMIAVTFKDGEGGPVKPTQLSIIGDEEKTVKIQIARGGYVNPETGEMTEIDLRKGYLISTLPGVDSWVGYGGELDVLATLPFVGPSICSESSKFGKLDFTYTPNIYEDKETYLAKIRTSVEEKPYILKRSSENPLIYELDQSVLIVPEDCIGCAGTNSIRAAEKDNVVISVGGDVVATIETKKDIADSFLDIKDLLGANLDVIVSKLFPQIGAVNKVNKIINDVVGDRDD
jgi:hypothetical protein